MRRFAEALATLERADRWLLPGACLLCQEVAEGGDADPLICALCLGRFRRLPHPQCRRCGEPRSSIDQPCRVCAGWPAGFGPVRSAVWLDDAARRAMHHLKYGGWPRIGEALARLMAETLDAPPEAILVPVPLSRRRFRRRGYNQAEALARGLGRHSGRLVRTDLLVRVRETGTQTALAPEARQANVRDAFALPDGARSLLRKSGFPLVLIDDVFTTGATLRAAAAVLAEGGTNRVEAVTFARALPPLG
ncbi:MAG TPA: ComF family protein [Gemmatimonadales bacterium]|nr:ComF family protein [Gemmatimonadales bacterium]